MATVSQQRSHSAQLCANNGSQTAHVSSSGSNPRDQTVETAEPRYPLRRASRRVDSNPEYYSTTKKEKPPQKHANVAAHPPSTPQKKRLPHSPAYQSKKRRKCDGEDRPLNVFTTRHSLDPLESTLTLSTLQKRRISDSLPHQTKKRRNPDVADRPQDESTTRHSLALTAENLQALNKASGGHVGSPAIHPMPVVYQSPPKSAQSTSGSSNKSSGNERRFQGVLVLNGIVSSGCADDLADIGELQNPSEQVSPLPERILKDLCEKRNYITTEADVQRFFEILMAETPSQRSTANIRWDNVATITGGQTSPPQPDIYYGVSIYDLPREFVAEFSGALQVSISPLAAVMPHTVVELKGLGGSQALAIEQCAHSAAVACRGIQKVIDFITHREKEVNKSVVQAWTVTPWHMTHYAMYVENKDGRIRYILATIGSYALITTKDLEKARLAFLSSLKTYAGRYSFYVKWWQSQVNLNLDRWLQDSVRDGEEKERAVNTTGPPDLSTNSKGKDKQE